MNTRVDRITCRQARIGGFDPFPSPSLEVLANKDDDASDDEDDASSFSDDEMMTSQ